MVILLKISLLLYISCLSIKLISDPWEVYFSTNQESRLIRTSSPFQFDGDMYFATEHDVYRYSDGNLTSYSDENLASWVEHYFFRQLHVDSEGNIIAMNNKGYAIKYDDGWEFFDKDNARYIQFTKGFIIEDGNVVISNPSGFLQYLRMDQITQKYLFDPKYDSINTESSSYFQMGKHKVTFDNQASILDVQDGDIGIVDLNSFDARIINEDINLVLDKSASTYLSWSKDDKVIYGLSNADTTASLLIFEKDDIRQYSVDLLDPKPTEFINARIGGYQEYDEGYFVALNQHLYYYKGDNMLEIKPPESIGDGEVISYSALEYYKNDTLFAFTFNHGFFKAYIPDLLINTSVEEPIRQWGINQLESMEVYPNPIIKGSLFIKLYVGKGNTDGLATEVYDMQGNVANIGDISFINIQGNIFTAELNIENLSPGVYFVKHTDTWGEATSKFIIE